MTTTPQADFIDLRAFAQAVARELRGSFDQPVTQRVFDMEQAAEYCGMPVASFKEKVVRDRIRKVRLDRKWRFDKADLDAWIDGHKEDIHGKAEA